MNGKSKILCFALACILGGSLIGCGNNNTPSVPDNPNGSVTDDSIPGANTVRPVGYTPSQQETVNSLSATDEYGRGFSAVDSMTSKKKVGIFYFVWLGNNLTAVCDNSRLTESELRQKLNNAENAGAQYYYGEPLYGYYNSSDPWVIRKHIELFMYAGIDYMCIDVTNGIYWDNRQDYRPTIKQILEILLEYQSAGFTVPQVMFYTNTDSAQNVRILYDAFYDSENYELRKYDSLWFNDTDTGNANRGRKPWIVATDEFATLPDTVKNRFYKRDSQWPVPMWSYNENGMPWMSWVTTDNGARPQNNHNGIMSVSVAQHVSGWFSSSVDGSNGFNYGRGYSQTDNKNNDERINTGVNFQEQWDYAISQPDVNNIFITGWNEWCAQMQSNGNLVDCVTVEYSRDTEMMRGGYGDAFFIQLADNIRRFKGVSSPGAWVNPFATEIDIGGGDEQWDGTKGYIDIIGETDVRNYKSNMIGVSDYFDDSGRNDIKSVRVTYDRNNIYLRIECADTISEYDGNGNWMNVLFSVDGTSGADWEGYNYIVNRAVNGNVSSVERFASDGTSVRVGDAHIKKTGKVLVVSVPRVALGVSGEKFEFGFKVADNVTNPTDITDYYVSGDSAPCGRLNYTFRVK